MRNIPVHVLAAVSLLTPVAWGAAATSDKSGLNDHQFVARPFANHRVQHSLNCAANCASAVSISNVRNNGVVHSGFLVGTASAGDSSAVSLVEISLDGGQTFHPATGTSNWKFRLPAGKAGWKDNSLHTVNVRSTDSSGAVTSSTTLSVRKGANQDVNGDGFADVLVAAPAFDNNRGRVYLFYSANDGSGIPSTADANDLDDVNVHVIGGEFNGPQLFGAATAMGDVNGDGFADLIVGAPASINGAGHLYVFYAIEVAPGSALVVQGNATGTSTQLSGDTGRLLGLGASVAAGDVNGDGIADVVAGAPGTADTPEGQVGRAYVFFARNDSLGEGLTPATVFGANNTIVGDSSHTNFGIAVAMGDVNGDGFADVMAGANFSGGTKGQVYVFHAATDSTGIPSTIDDVSGVRATTVGDANTHIVGEETSELGTALVVGDLNGDGFEDVVASGPSFGNNRGRVYVFYSAGQNGVPTNPTIDENNTTPGQHVIGGAFFDNDQLFGKSTAIGDVNGDGSLDLIVGAPVAFLGGGRVYVFHTTPGTGLAQNQGNAINRTSQIDGDGQNGVKGALGLAVATGDVNGDGVMDVIAGAPGNNIVAGRAFVFHTTAINGNSIGGLPRGVDGVIRLSDANTTAVGGASSFFGLSIAR